MRTRLSLGSHKLQDYTDNPSWHDAFLIYGFAVLDSGGLDFLPRVLIEYRYFVDEFVVAKVFDILDEWSGRLFDRTQRFGPR